MTDCLFCKIVSGVIPATRLHEDEHTRYCSSPRRVAQLWVGGTVVAAVAAPMLERHWYELAAVFKAGQVELTQRALQISWGCVR